MWLKEYNIHKALWWRVSEELEGNAATYIIGRVRIIGPGSPKTLLKSMKAREMMPKTQNTM
jgi:hypothetical protein